MIVVIGADDAFRQKLLAKVAPAISADRVVLVGSVEEYIAWASVPDNPPVLHLIVHVAHAIDEAAPGSTRAQLTKLLRRAEHDGSPLSVLFERMQIAATDDLPLGDLSIVFGRSVVDQAVEIRTEDDLEQALSVIAEHAVSRATTALAHLEVVATERGLHTVGSKFSVLEEDYGEARLRALISAKMAGFIAELRDSYSQLEKWPLRRDLPWDPRDGQVPCTAINDNGIWQAAPIPKTTPNLQDVLNVPTFADFSERLKGEKPPYTADGWREAWSGRLPPMLLLTGESGTGKSLVAETLALLLAKRERTGNDSWVSLMPPFAKINSAGLTETTWEHVVHGAAPGTWSGMPQAVIGELARAAHGVVFFDEIGDLPPSVQAGLLTFFDDRLIRPTGTHPFKGFQHVIAATNRDLEEGTNQRWFRNDLLARFALRLRIPSLRERGREEVKQLIDFLMQDPAVNPKRPDARHAVCFVTDEALDKLSGFEYLDGNFRELTEIVHAAVRRAERRHSRLLEAADVTLPGEPRSRSERNSDRVSVSRIELPRGTPLVTVMKESDLRVLAHREGRAVTEDEDGRAWVMPASTAFTVKPTDDEV